MDVKTQMALAVLEVEDLPPLLAIVKTNKSLMRDWAVFTPIMTALLVQAFAKLDEAVQKCGADGSDKSFTFYSSFAIGRAFNDALGPDCPNIIAMILMEAGKGWDFTIRSMVKNKIPGMHDCLRSDIVPVIKARPIENPGPESEQYNILSVDILPMANDDQFDPPTA